MNLIFVHDDQVRSQDLEGWLGYAVSLSSHLCVFLLGILSTEWYEP